MKDFIFIASTITGHMIAAFFTGSFKIAVICIICQISGGYLYKWMD